MEKTIYKKKEKKDKLKERLSELDKLFGLEKIIKYHKN
tara:strand:- start:467 stop:580 length:114 start_codon:yes stop_codon:yes gene_type:complete